MSTLVHEAFEAIGQDPKPTKPSEPVKPTKEQKKTEPLKETKKTEPTKPSAAEADLHREVSHIWDGLSSVHKQLSSIRQTLDARGRREKPIELKTILDLDETVRLLKTIMDKTYKIEKTLIGL